MTKRNSTALYPLWTVNFYFNKIYYGAYGIQVGLWGDTKEVFYCESLITLGNSGGESPTTAPSNSPPTDATPAQPSNPAETTPNNPATSPSPEVCPTISEQAKTE